MLLRLYGVMPRPLGKPFLFLAGSCAFAAGAACFSVLPSQSYRTHADVEVLASAGPGPVTRIGSEAAHAAARVLLAQGVSPPVPHLFDRLAVAAGRAHATDGETRLATELLKDGWLVQAASGNRLELWSEARHARQATRFAEALAAGFAASENRIDASWRAARAKEAAERVRRLEAEAVAAHVRLETVEPVVAPPPQPRVSSAQPAELRARLDMIRAILAAGGPPLSDRRDMPPSIEGLQNNYLDLQRQLLKARQTLGDRHITIITLQADLKKAAADLVAEWQRLKRITEAELKALRSDGAAEARRAPLDNDAPSAERIAARRIAEIADQKLTEAVEAQLALAGTQTAYRVAGAAVPPVLSGGLPSWLRFLMSGAGAALGFVALCRLAAGRDERALPESPPESLPASLPESLPATIADEPVEAPLLETPEVPVGDDPAEVEDAATVPSFWTAPPPSPAVQSRRLLIATTERGVATLPYAVGAAYAAIEIGLKVLIVESERDVPTLAAMAGTGAEPETLVLDGVRRKILRAEQGNGHLFVAPHPVDADLAEPDALRETTESFDLVVIDGGYFEAAVASGWRAEAYQRIGHVSSDEIEAAFAQAFAVSPDAVLDPILVPVRVPLPVVEAPRRGGFPRGRRGLMTAEGRRLQSLRRSAASHRS